MDVFEALADPVRRELVRAVASAGPARVGDLAAPLPVSRPAVSRHLRLLTEAALLSVEDRGRERHYGLEPAGLAPVADLLAELTGAPAAPRVSGSTLDALDLEVRRTVGERRTADGDEREAIG